MDYFARLYLWQKFKGLNRRTSAGGGNDCLAFRLSPLSAFHQISYLSILNWGGRGNSFSTGSLSMEVRSDYRPAGER